MAARNSKMSATQLLLILALCLSSCRQGSVRDGRRREDSKNHAPPSHRNLTSEGRQPTGSSSDLPELLVELLTDPPKHEEIDEYSSVLATGQYSRLPLGLKRCVGIAIRLKEGDSVMVKKVSDSLGVAPDARSALCFCIASAIRMRPTLREAFPDLIKQYSIAVAKIPKGGLRRSLEGALLIDPTLPEAVTD